MNFQAAGCDIRSSDFDVIHQRQVRAIDVKHFGSYTGDLEEDHRHASDEIFRETVACTSANIDSN